MNYTNNDLAILKTICSDKKSALEFLSAGDPKYFSPELLKFSKAVYDYIKSYKEIPTLKTLTEKHVGKNEDLIKYISKCWKLQEDFVFDKKEFKYELEKLKKKYADLEILKLKEKINNLDADNIDLNKVTSEINKTSSTIKQLNSDQKTEVKSIKEYCNTFKKQFQEKRKDENFESGIQTGYSFFDAATGGLKGSDLVIVAAESGFGKSTLLANFGAQIWLQQNNIYTPKDQFKDGKNIIYVSIEMPYEQMFARLLSRLASVSYRKIEKPKRLSKEEFLKVKTAVEFIENYPWMFDIVDIPSASSNDIEAILAEKLATQQVDCLFVDYLGIMETNENKEEQDWLKQGVVAQELRKVGRIYNIPILTAAQLNRKQSTSKDSNDHIGLHRIARSHALVSHATTILQIESRANESLLSDFKIHTIKNRNGPKPTGLLIKDFDCCTLIDQPMENNDEFIDVDDISTYMENFEFDFGDE